jgi:hypothetical protein
VRSRKYEVLPQQFDESSDAIVLSTWYYLRAFQQLDPELRQSESILAQGAAALVAAEMVYPGNWACLPSEVQEAAAMVNLLCLYSPELLAECFTNGGARRPALLTTAFGKMCSVPGTNAVSHEVHRNWQWLVAADSDVHMGELLPPHPASLETAARLMHEKVQNLSLRSLLIAASCAPRYQIPYYDP